MKPMGKRKRRGKLIPFLVNAVLIIGIAWTGWKIGNELLQQRQSASLSDSLWAMAVGKDAAPVYEGGGTTEVMAGPQYSTPQEAEEGTKTPETEGETSRPEPTAVDEPALETETAERNRTEPENERRSEGEPAAQRKTAERNTMESGQESRSEGRPAADTEEAERNRTEPKQEDSSEGKPASVTETAGPNGTGIRQTAPAESEFTAGPEAPDQHVMPFSQETVAGNAGTADSTPNMRGQGTDKTVDAEKAFPVYSAAPRWTDAPEVPEQINFAPLREVSRNVKAWLHAPDTGLNQVVAQAEDNEYYLRHLLDGRYNTAGTLFIDCRNRGNFTDRNTIIYGHSMRNKSMFGRLIEYQEADYCREHPFLYLYVPGHRFRLEVVASFGAPDNSEFYTLPVSWAAWRNMLEKAKAKTAWDFGIEYDAQDHFVTLSTCAYEIHRERWLLIARIDDPEGVLDSGR